MIRDRERREVGVSIGWCVSEWAYQYGMANNATGTRVPERAKDPPNIPCLCVNPREHNDVRRGVEDDATDHRVWFLDAMRYNGWNAKGAYYICRFSVNREGIDGLLETWDDSRR